MWLRYKILCFLLPAEIISFWPIETMQEKESYSMTASLERERKRERIKELKKKKNILLNRELKENSSTKSYAEVTVKMDIAQHPTHEAPGYGNRIMSMLWNSVQISFIKILFGSWHLRFCPRLFACYHCSQLHFRLNPYHVLSQIWTLTWVAKWIRNDSKICNVFVLCRVCFWG